MTEKLPAVRTLGEAKLASFASEIVHGFKELEDILADYYVSPEEYERLRLNPFFIKIMEAEAAAWAGANNAQERARVKASLLVEDLLPELNARLHDKKESLEDVIRGAQTLIKIAGIGERVNPAHETTVQDKFVIQINMGGNQEVTFSKDKAPTPPNTIEGKANETPAVSFLVPTSDGNNFFSGE